MEKALPKCFGVYSFFSFKSCKRSHYTRATWPLTALGHACGASHHKVNCKEHACVNVCVSYVYV